MKIGKLAQISKISVHAIRYYEKIGLLPKARRDPSGQREYEESILVWIGFLSRLKATGMSIKDMLIYARLREQGDATQKARQDILIQHREKVAAELAELHVSLGVLDEKIALYGTMISKEENKNHGHFQDG